jgi:hypothetical protein
MSSNAMSVFVRCEPAGVDPAEGSREIVPGTPELLVRRYDDIPRVLPELRLKNLSNTFDLPVREHQDAARKTAPGS